MMEKEKYKKETENAGDGREVMTEHGSDVRGDKERQ